ncbi:maleylpyruvate isomerase family mycothiol-dependent enzyme [uncultured Jatrophihabitans sp.]|uniref:maleylpyruvate isomerase family mycothiol-dependent enzyme n=1 Tax=uncultured Jatrophihabitans sp. TaxID=1610747 RepID=UPI0035CC2625
MTDEMDPVTEWSAARRRVSLLVALLDPATANAPVPATPDWSVRDLLAHMVGLGVDVVAGDEPDDHNAAWTQRHVDDRRDRDIADLLAEWDDVAPQLESWMRAHNPRPLGDVIIHEQDLRGALGVPGGQDTPGLRAIRDQMVTRFAPNVTGALTLQGEQWSWSSPGDGPRTVVTASDFDLARAVVSRRSAAQLRSWTTSGDVEPFLDAFAVLGSLPDADLVE